MNEIQTIDNFGTYEVAQVSNRIRVLATFVGIFTTRFNNFEAVYREVGAGTSSYAMALYHFLKLYESTGVAYRYGCEANVMRIRQTTTSYWEGVKSTIEGLQQPYRETTEEIVEHIRRKEEFIDNINNLCDTATQVIESTVKVINRDTDLTPSISYSAREKEDWNRAIRQAKQILHVGNTLPPDTDKKIEQIEQFRQYVISLVEPY